MCEELKSCPACGNDNILRSGPEPSFECAACEVSVAFNSYDDLLDLASWNALPRREEFRAELMSIILKFTSINGCDIEREVLKLSMKYAPVKEGNDG